MEPPKWPAFLSKMQQSDTFMDLVLECNGREFKINSALASVQSPVIERAISPSLGFQESKTKRFIIQDTDADAVERMVQFMHTGNYDDDISAKTKKISATTKKMLLCHVHVNKLADFLQIPDLSSLAAEKMAKLLGQHWSADLFFDTAATLSDEMHCKNLWGALGTLAAAHIHELLRDDRFAGLENLGTFALQALRECVAINRREIKEIWLSRAKSDDSDLY
ncbi:hypothetical protein E4U41_004555 [Claviceps citrina]|nr:hypothetical protein E4U41_004555 [Claviceps citrina]